jgi:hypothetical protein
MLSARDERDDLRRRKRQRVMTCYRFKLGDEAQRDACICIHAFRNLLSVGRRSWARLMKSAISAAPGPLKHGNVGLRNRYKGSVLRETEDDVVNFIMQVGEEHGESYATRYVRERTSIGLRNDEDDVIDLPSSFSKRKLYER